MRHNYLKAVAFFDCEKGSRFCVLFLLLMLRFENTWQCPVHYISVGRDFKTDADRIIFCADRIIFDAYRILLSFSRKDAFSSSACRKKS